MAGSLPVQEMVAPRIGHAAAGTAPGARGSAMVP